MLNEKLSDKIEELNIIMKKLSFMDKNSNIKEICIIKSTIIIMMYNILESMVTEILGYLHDCIQRVPFDKLNKKYIKIILFFYFAKKDKYEDKDCDYFIKNNFIFPSFLDYAHKKKLFSGNLDLRKINKILKLNYGINEIKIENSKDGGDSLESHSKVGEHILKIKNKRNKLAHGDESFLEASRGMSFSDIEKIRDSLEKVLRCLIQEINNYIEKKLYQKTG